MELKGDVGAKEIIQKHPESVALVSVKDPRTLMDIDTRASYCVLAAGLDPDWHAWLATYRVHRPDALQLYVALHHPLDPLGLQPERPADERSHLLIRCPAPQ